MNDEDRDIAQEACFWAALLASIVTFVLLALL